MKAKAVIDKWGNRQIFRGLRSFVNLSSPGCLKTESQESGSVVLKLKCVNESHISAGDLGET